MRNRRSSVSVSIVVAAFMLSALAVRDAHAQSIEERLAVDVGVGLDFSINGNINSGAIGRLQGQATAILPNPYGEVYGSGIQLRFGAGYALNETSELRGVFTYQSADADLVRLGDIGPSSLYAQYSDYKSLGLDLGYRRYVPLSRSDIRPYAEATIGLAAIDRINALLAAPQSNLVLESTDLYDGTSAFTWSFGVGALFRVAKQVDVNAQIGLRHVSGLAEVDQFAGTGLEGINNDTGRLTFPVVVGIRFRFK